MRGPRSQAPGAQRGGGAGRAALGAALLARDARLEPSPAPAAEGALDASPPRPSPPPRRPAGCSGVCAAAAQPGGQGRTNRGGAAGGGGRPGGDRQRRGGYPADPARTPTRPAGGSGWEGRGLENKAPPVSRGNGRGHVATKPRAARLGPRRPGSCWVVVGTKTLRPRVTWSLGRSLPGISGPPRKRSPGTT